MNLFTWSIPFISEKVTEMMHHIIKPNQTFDMKGTSNNDLAEKQKIIDELLRIQKKQSEERMQMVDIEASMPDERLLESAGKKINNLKDMKKQSFEEKKDFDSKN
jgi:hypothetical protein